jgi:hypothetical protein
MRHALRATGTLLVVGVAVSIPVGCGGGKTIIHIGGAHGASIGLATLDHWMQALAGGDFREAIGAEGPRGLVSEPAHYGRCIDAAKLVAPRSFFNQLQLSRVALDQKCHELYSSIKAQALSFLISAQWALIEGAERGVEVSGAEVKRAFERIRRRQYPTEPDLRRYLTERQWSLSDLLYRLKDDLLENRLRPRSGTIAAAADGGPGYAKVLAERRDRMIARTMCLRGYVVPGCSAYRGPPTPSPTPEAILVHLVRKNS